MPSYHAYYAKKGIWVFSSVLADEIIIADNIAEAKAIADKHAKEMGYELKRVSEFSFLKMKKEGLV